MTNQEILYSLQGKSAVLTSREESGVLNAEVEKDKIRETISYLLDGMGFNHLNFMTALDLPKENSIEVIYRFFSYTTKAAVVIRARLDRVKPEIATVSDIFRTAEWHEREAAEMFGITFLNHPDPRPLLLPDGFKGSPLRKDFKHTNMTPLPEVK